MISSGSTASAPHSTSKPESGNFENLLPGFVLLAGFIARLIPAWRFFLNPDEALHNLLASQATVGRAYEAALTNAHPPLLILTLYFWRTLGHSELWLRMPSVLAGTAACWLVYQWLKLVADRSAAFLGLLLMAFAPSLIYLSAEIRQYALLLFFMTACLYLSELSLRRTSPGLMVLFSLSLYGALLTHYSSFMFAFAIGVYLLVRLYPFSPRLGLSLVWACGQAVGVALSLYFLLTHLPRLRQNGMAREGFDTYLRKSIFHSSDHSAIVFVTAQTVRVFTYLFSHGVVGALMLLIFLVGLAWLLRQKPLPDHGGPSPRQFALLLILPFVTNWGAALAGLYPLGATRHNSFLAPFAIAGASIGIARLMTEHIRTAQFAAVGCLVLCNFFPAPPPLIRPRDQSVVLMRNAALALQSSAAPGSVIFTDYESGLLLGYYVCGHGVVQVFPPLTPMSKTDCGAYSVIATSDREWKFTGYNFGRHLSTASQTFALVPNTNVWIFYAGWINDSAPSLTVELQHWGCPTPQTFGQNILMCRLALQDQGLGTQ